MHYCIYFRNCHSTFPKNIFIFRSNFRYNRLINLFIIIYLILICNDKWLVKIIVYLIVQRCMHVCTKLERSEKNIFITYNLSIKFSKKLILCYKNTTSLISRYRMNLKKKEKEKGRRNTITNKTLYRNTDKDKKWIMELCDKYFLNEKFDYDDLST